MAAFLASRKAVQGKAGSKKGAGSTQPAPAAKQKSSVVLKPPAARPEAASAQSTQRSAPGGNCTSCRGTNKAEASACTVDWQCNFSLSCRRVLQGPAQGAAAEDSAAASQQACCPSRSGTVQDLWQLQACWHAKG